MGKRHKKSFYKKSNLIQRQAVDSLANNEKVESLNENRAHSIENSAELTKHPIKQELTKVGLTFLILISLLAGVVILNNKTTALESFSTKLTNFLHIY